MPNHITNVIFALAVLTLIADISVAETATSEKRIAGYVENVILYPGKIMLRAKIDSGAKHSSLNAQAIAYFTKGTTDWVRFQLTNKAGESVVFERPVVRIASIRRHFLKLQKRPVIKLGLCLDAVYKEIEVNLVDRSGLNYQMLVGRTYLKGGFLIDPEKSFLLKPACDIE